MLFLTFLAVTMQPEIVLNNSNLHQIACSTLAKVQQIPKEFSKISTKLRKSHKLHIMLYLCDEMGWKKQLLLR